MSAAYFAWLLNEDYAYFKVTEVYHTKFQNVF